MDYPLIAVVGNSGTGKSYALRNLPIETTKIINIERKPLPFKHGYKFGKNLVNVTNAIPDFINTIQGALAAPDINTVVLESGTKFLELALNFSKRAFKGYDIYNNYNSTITHLLETIKANNNKIVIFIAIPEIVKEMTPYGGEITSKRIATAGKEWEGKIDKEFTIVLYTDVKQEKGNPKAEYRFMTNTDGTNSAKSPPDLFGANNQFIDNDLNAVVEKVMAYYELMPNVSKEQIEKIRKENAEKYLTSPEVMNS